MFIHAEHCVCVSQRALFLYWFEGTPIGTTHHYFSIYPTGYLDVAEVGMVINLLTFLGTTINPLAPPESNGNAETSSTSAIALPSRLGNLECNLQSNRCESMQCHKTSPAGWKVLAGGADLQVN